MALLGRRGGAADSSPVPVRTITKGPAFHWFGYYDKFQFCPRDRFVLSNQVTFQHRSPTADDAIRVGMVDLEDGDRWIDLGGTRAWCWQQGCMLQWVPGSTNEVIWNDREGDAFVSRVMNVETRAVRTLPRPVYTLSPDGRFAMTLAFERVQRLRPGYGYASVPDRDAARRVPEEGGLWRMDLATGRTELVFSLAQAAALPHEGRPLDGWWHWFNHLLVSPDGKRCIFLHRWRKRHRDEPGFGLPDNRFHTRMFTIGVDGRDPFIIDPSGFTSHFVWKNEREVTMFTRPQGRPEAFYTIEDRTGRIEPVGAGVMTENGHNTWLPAPCADWVLNDTYPSRGGRLQRPYLFHAPTGRRVELGGFHAPAAYVDEWRCDTHPRSSRRPGFVCIDSAHGGSGRQLHLLDIRGVLGV